MSSEHDINLVTAKAGSVIAEGLKLSLATPGGSLTPATITAMVGISTGQALQFAPEVNTVMTALNKAATNVGGVYSASTVSAASAAYANLTTLQSKIMPSGNHGAFGSFLTQAQGHISDSIEVKNAMSFISNSSFTDLGSGVTNMTSMLDQGIGGSLGNLGSVGEVFTSTGKIFNTKDMTSFGTPSGFWEQLSSNKLANSTGLNKALSDAGVDLQNISDPVYKDKVLRVMEGINDPAIIRTVSTQLEVTVSDAGTTTSVVETGVTTSFSSPTASLNTSLKDFLDVKRIVPPSVADSLKGGMESIGQKFKDMGASFASGGAAKNMLGNLSLPSLPKLNAMSLNSMMGGDVKANIESMMGTNLTSSPNGIPNMSDFWGSVGGGGQMRTLSQSTNISSIISGVESQVATSKSLISKAGIDLDAPPPAGLATAKNFAEGLHKFGADTSGSGISQMLSNMANGNNKFGEAIKASLAEGKNKALLQAAGGIKPIDFSGVPVGEAAKNLQEGKFIPGTGSMTPQQINSIFGSGTS